MEESVVTFNVFHHVAWGTTISVYFWLLGVSAGSFLISTIGWVFDIERYKPLTLTASITAILMLALVPVLLIWDLGQPVRFIYLLIPGYWHSTGPMAWGTALILSFSLAMVVFSFFVFIEDKKWAKIVGIVAIVLALATRWYTGVVMELNPGRHLNSTALAPLLFLVSAFVSGAGLLIVVLWIQNLFRAAEKRIKLSLIVEIAKYMKYFIILDLFLLFLDFTHGIYGSRDLVLAHDVVLMEIFRFPYLWLEIAIGLVIPLVILSTPLRLMKSGAVTAAFLAATGAYGMRIWWVLGGQYLQSFY